MTQKLWHDDVRRPPDNTWVWARTNKVAMAILLMADVAGKPIILEASLDHDMGLHDQPSTNQVGAAGESPEGDGLDLVQAMIALRLIPPKVTIHSHNHERAKYMKSLLDAAAQVYGIETAVTIRPYEAP